MDPIISNTINENLDANVKKAHKQKWLRIILIIGAIYCLDGIVFGLFAGWSKSHIMVIIWRLAAWLTSAVLFSGHIWYEHYRFRYSPHRSSLHISSAVAVGAFGLAVAANIHAQFVSSANHIFLVLSLVIWPILTAVPAFIVAYAITSVLHHYHKKVPPKE
jgi:hypothetical protein